MKLNRLLLTLVAAHAAFACAPSKESACNKDVATDKFVSRTRDYINKLKFKHGGNSLSNGSDGPGFVQRYYDKFGIELPRDIKDQFKRGKDVKISGSFGVSNAKVGDLLFTCHSNGTPKAVLIYTGNNVCVHANEGVTVVTEVKLEVLKPKICKIRRVFEYTKPKKVVPPPKKPKLSVCDKIIAEAKGYVGKLKFAHGGTSLKIGVDNAGFVQQIFKKYNISLKRTAKQQMKQGTMVKLHGKYGIDKAIAGDLLFTCDHNSVAKEVFIYIGDKTYITCSSFSKKVVKVRIDSKTNICGIRRIIA